MLPDIYNNIIIAKESSVPGFGSVVEGVTKDECLVSNNKQESPNGGRGIAANCKMPIVLDDSTEGPSQAVAINGRGVSYTNV